MKIYIATKFENKQGFNDMRDILEASGHEITTDWTKHTYENSEGMPYGEFLVKCANEDFDGVFKADGLVLLPNEKGGAHFTELGVAMCLAYRCDYPIVVVGFDKNVHARNIFYSHPAITHVKTMADVPEALRFLNHNAEQMGSGLAGVAAADQRGG